MEVTMKRRNIHSYLIIPVLTFLSLGSMGLAQDNPFIPQKLFSDLNNEISGDRAYDYIRWLSHFHRIMGSKAYLEAAQLMSKFAEDFGLTNVQVNKQKFIGGFSWDPTAAELWLIEPHEQKIACFPEVSVSLAIRSRSAQGIFELIDVGEGTVEEDFTGKNIAGKVVLTSSDPSAVMKSAVWTRGAAGVISSYSLWRDAAHDTPDQIAYAKIPLKSTQGIPGTWAFMISPRQRTMLQQLLREGRTKNETVKVKVDIKTELKEAPEQAYTWAEIEGSLIHDQDIVLTAHLDEERTSANDNGSGCAVILEIGRTINRLMELGKTNRPKRDIIFWWPNEHHSEYQYFRENPAKRKEMLVNINLDMVGAKQSMGSRVQHIIRTPHSIPSYLSDVIESIAEYVTICNTGFFAAEMAGTPQPFAKPILSFLGSREKFDSMIVPFCIGSDHDVFCQGIIGIPGVSLINNPDPYFHSSADDLSNVDATQLKRNAFIVAAAALFIANAGDAEAPMIASEVYSRGLRRLGKDLNTALFHLRNKAGGSYQQAYKEARNLLEKAVIRESKALESALVFTVPQGKNEIFVKKLVGKIIAAENHYLEDLDSLYLLVSGKKKLQVLKAEEAADLLKVDLQTIYRMIKRKELPAFRVGRCWRINAQDLEKLCRTMPED